MRLSLPPLRERADDVPLLVEHFVERFAHVRRKDITGVAPEVMRLLTRYDFPGNVRELENIIEHAFVMCPEGLIDAEHLPLFLTEGERHGPAESSEPLGAAERATIVDSLERNNWHRARAAKALGIHPSTLWRKMKRYRITSPHRDGRSDPHYGD